MNIIREFFENITALGSLVFMGVMGLFFLLTDFPVFLKLLMGIGCSTLIIILIRSFYFKRRPVEKVTPYKYLDRINKSSFPSMHASNVTIFSITMGVFLGQSLLWFFLPFAALIIFSRLYLKIHDVVDLAGGTVLGGLISLAVILLL